MQVTKLAWVWGGFALGAISTMGMGCSSDDSPDSRVPSTGGSRTSSSGGTSGTTMAGGGSTTTAGSPAAPTGGSDDSGGSSGSGSAGASNAIPFSAGSREFNHIVNLVDADATAEVEAVLRTATGMGLPLSTKL